MSTILTAPTNLALVHQKDIHVPFSGQPARAKIMGLLSLVKDEQQVAASATLRHIVRSPGNLRRLLIGVATAPASGETMVIDVQKNGTTILTATQEAENAQTTAGVYDVTGQINTTSGPVSFVVGDVIEIVRTYTAGGGPAMNLTDVTLEIA